MVRPRRSSSRTSRWSPDQMGSCTTKFASTSTKRTTTIPIRQARSTVCSRSPNSSSIGRPVRQPLRITIREPLQTAPWAQTTASSTVRSISTASTMPRMKTARSSCATPTPAAVRTTTSSTSLQAHSQGSIRLPLSPCSRSSARPRSKARRSRNGASARLPRLTVTSSTILTGMETRTRTKLRQSASRTSPSTSTGTAPPAEQSAYSMPATRWLARS